jgi:penicillin-binding protein A
VSTTSAPGRPARRPPGGSREEQDRDEKLRLRRLRAAGALAGVAFVIGAILGAGHTASPAYALAARFVAQWTRGEYAGMYSDIHASSRRTTSLSEFVEAYEQALRTATATGLRVTGKPHGVSGDLVAVPVRVSTRVFGTLALSFALGIGGGGGKGRGIAWSRSLAFPGLRPGELLTRETTLPQRAPLLARDGTVLAESAASGTAGSAQEASAPSSPLGGAASAVVGNVGPVPVAERAELEAQGVPPGAIVGVSGLERAFDEDLRGTPGGELIAASPQPGAEGRVLASATQHAATPVRTTVSPAVQRAAVTALGSQFGGIVAIAPSSGQVLAVAGVGLDGLQPPGSTFKIVTVTGALQAGIANPRSVFPYATYATLDGVQLHNANGEECGGTLELAFAVSCNSVFAPLGVKLGAARLVATAERFGFNQEPGVPGAAESTLPAAEQIEGELDLGSTAIGQGRVLASALQMATVAATIADGGSRPQPTFAPDGAPGARAPVTSAAVAHTVRHLMIDVVREGTGTAAAIPGVTVAGKTGTAELKTPSSSCSATSERQTHESSGGTGVEACYGTGSEASNTDAWFAAFAPALHPRIAVGVLLVKDGAGGATAAPIAREVLEAGLQAGH